MQLADFIDHHTESIVAGAEEFAATLLPAARHLDAEGRRDHIPMILEAIAKDLRAPQTPEDQITKSLGGKPRAHGAPETAAQTHALLRAKSGFDIEQLVAEYRGLRASVLRLWMATGEPVDADAHLDIIRFNEAIDQAVAESVTFFTAEVERWRHVFLGVLGHDLRGPLNAILLTAELLNRLASQTPLTAHTTRLMHSGKRMKGLLDDFLDYSRASLGVGIGVRRAPTDLAAACAEEIEVLRSALPDCPIDYQAEGSTGGNYDASRIREALNNLVANAARYRTAGSEVRVRLIGDADTLRLSVENSGTQIPGDVLDDLFEPLRRGQQPAEQLAERANLGLGLFIVREVARAHDGEVQALSADGATCFTMTLPADPPATSANAAPSPGTAG